MCKITHFSDPERKPYFQPDPRKDMVNDLQDQLCPECLALILAYMDYKPPKRKKHDKDILSR